MPEESAHSEEHPSHPDPQVPAPSSRSALMIVFLVVFIDLLGFGIVLPLLPRYADSYLKVLVGDSPALVGAILGLLMASFSAMQFFFAPVWGRISDRIGRRPVLLIGLTGSVVFYALLGFASGLSSSSAATLAVVLLFIARIGAGLAGATISTAQAVIADCTPPEKRKHGMALIGAAFGIGFTFGPLFGFAALTFFPEHLEATGYTAALMSLIALALGLRILPETRKFEEAPPVSRKWVDWKAIRTVLALPALAPVILTFFLATLGFAGFEVTLALLCKDAMGMADKSTFLIFAYVGFVLMLTQGFLYRRMAKKLNEVTLMTIGIVLMGVGVVSLGLVSRVCYARTAEIVEQSFGLTALGGGSFILSYAQEVVRGEMISWLLVSLAVAVVGFAFLTPSAQALISRRSEASRQGEILGVNQSASALARILGPIIGLFLYKLTPTHLLPYFFGGGLVLLMLPLIPRVKKGGEQAGDEMGAPEKITEGVEQVS